MMKSVVSILSIMFVLLCIVGCNSNTKYLSALEESVYKESDKATQEMFMAEMTLPEIAKNSEYILVGTLQNDILEKAEINISTDEVETFLEMKGAKENSIVYTNEVAYFDIESVLYGDIDSKQIKLVQASELRFVEPGEKVVIFVTTYESRDSDTLYCVVAGFESVFLLNDENTVYSMSGSKYTANYDNLDIDLLTDDVMKAVVDDEIEIFVTY